MKCPFCNASNYLNAPSCVYCDEPLSQNVQDKVLPLSPITSQQYKYKKILIPLLLVLFAILGMLILNNLWSPTEESLWAKKKFLMLKKSYESDPVSWIQKKDQILNVMQGKTLKDDWRLSPMEFNYVPLEVIYAFLDDNLEFFKHSKAFIYPTISGERTSVIIGKEVDFFSFHKTYLIEFDLKIIDRQLQTKMYRFLEGDKKRPIENAGDIFKKELSLLRSLESFAGGIESFFWSIERSKQSQKKLDNLSWLYYDRAIR